ncbi:Hsp70 family protein [Telmatocola sphagniphila]|uniref:Hsp70 family protein n=1 Tax=Telmatocola sphagniphila TaxID=1123043 RepID=A0A8E6B2B7_9BACT|nr:Hsp70 family protein [Telmatocola sphagniphila]QVL30613.1 Hsp70 family protein [Telmatocola sphagniphila]
MASRFVIGIDLGTTNCALAYIDTGRGEDPHSQTLSIPQVVRAGLVEERPLLPSFLYLPGENEQPAGSLNLPWASDRDYAVGEFARNFGSQVPTRLVASAKSWLCHPGVDRKSPILPWKAPEGGRRISPLEASTRYLKHLAEAWNAQMAKELTANRLENQEIVLTVPASFDAVARELTVEAARAAGFEHLTLLEEPQAAFYAWLDSCGEKWREQVKVGDLILVADVGGGTTDFTLIEVAEVQGQLELTRLAVGDHLLLGGDNMDLALAHLAAQQFAAKGVKLDAAQMLALSYSARAAKESLLADPSLTAAPVTVLGRGSKVIGGTLKGELTKADVEKILLEGFLPLCKVDTEPNKSRAAGFQELGLPYVADPAISRHLAQFLTKQRTFLLERESNSKKKKKSPPGLPTAILFNGGVFKSPLLQDRFSTVLNGWTKEMKAESVRVLEGNDLDQAVARGAAYYGLVRRGKGIRIRGGTARSYYIGVESSMPAIPGMPAPLKALCVAPFGMEEGTETDIPSQEFGVIVGEPVEFRFLGSSLRRHDVPGTILEDWQGDVEELAPVQTTLGEEKSGRLIPVHLHTKVTEVGQLELWCFSRDGKERFKLEFNVREAE